MNYFFIKNISFEINWKLNNFRLFEYVFGNVCNLC